MNTMYDKNGVVLFVGDTITSPYTVGTMVIKREIAPDNAKGQGALVECRNQKGSRVDIRLTLAEAVVKRISSDRK